MVVVRFGRGDQLKRQRQVTVKQEYRQLDKSNNNMFKVPSSSSSSYQFNSQQQHQQQQQQQQQAEMFAAAKRKWQDSNTTLGLTPSERPLQKQKTSTPPLTIFYAGSVNVYENVPESMVRALMTLAAAKSSKPGAAMLSHLQKAGSAYNVNLKNNANGNSSVTTGHSAGSFGFLAAAAGQGSTGLGLPPVVHQSQQSQSQLNNRTATVVTGTGNGFSFPTSSTTATTTTATREDTSLSLNSFNTSSKPDGKASTPPSQASASPATSGSSPPGGDLKMNPRTKMQLLPNGLPQARRASIQRFLEKRKQKQVDNNSQGEDGDASGKSSTSNVPHFLRLAS